MEDFILEIFFEILGFIFEAIGEYILAAIWDLMLRAVGEVFQTSELPNPVLAAFGYVLIGLTTGGLSLLFLPHRLIRHSRVPGVSLIISPVMTGLMMALTGKILRRRRKTVTRMESFGYGFAFAFGVALVRFFWAK